MFLPAEALKDAVFNFESKDGATIFFGKKISGEPERLNFSRNQLVES